MRVCQFLLPCEKEDRKPPRGSEKVLGPGHGQATDQRQWDLICGENFSGNRGEAKSEIGLRMSGLGNRRVQNNKQGIPTKITTKR